MSTFTCLTHDIPLIYSLTPAQKQGNDIPRCVSTNRDVVIGTNHKQTRDIPIASLSFIYCILNFTPPPPHTHALPLSSPPRARFSLAMHYSSYTLMSLYQRQHTQDKRFPVLTKIVLSQPENHHNDRRCCSDTSS